MTKENNVDTPKLFETKDLKLSAYLMSRGMRLIDIKVSPYSHHDCAFVLTNPPQNILEDWINSSPCSGREILYQYKKLLAMSKQRYDNARVGVE